MKPAYIAIFAALLSVFMCFITIYAATQAKKKKGEG